MSRRTRFACLVFAAWLASAAEARAETSAPVEQSSTSAGDHWAFERLRRPAMPRVDDGDWLIQPVDAFILARLEKAQLKPSPPARRRELVRRAYYDLTGLPPSPEATEAFVLDNRPDALRRLIDELLESPHYGEKWGRHWLDVVRYAESNSYERDGMKPGAWRYRDYVIESFNQDKPFDQFLREQLAGDEIEPLTHEQIVATGFYRLGLWDDEPADTRQALYDELDDILTTVSQAMLGLTMNCARCHDHKLDPISQRDYYRMLAFFSGIHRYGGPDRIREGHPHGGRDWQQYSQRTIASPEEAARRQQAERPLESEFAAARGEIEAIHEEVRAVLPGGDRDDFAYPANRRAIIEQFAGKLYDKSVARRYDELHEELEKLEASLPPVARALCVTEMGAQPRDTHVLLRGNPHAPGDKVQPGFPDVLRSAEPAIAPPAHGDSSGRRLALAEWIASSDNPLTARVIVNRIWQHHFGRGIVRSPNNFGLEGEPPTHPQLLDWLAAEFVENRWSFKHLHRLIMTSATYQMASRSRSDGDQRDPANDLFWRFNPRRLTAEEVRDSIFAVSGRLNRKLGGPSFYPELPALVLAGQSRPGENWGESSDEERRRRSIYIYAKRSLVAPLLASFDMADTDFTCPVRFESIQPTQALALLNSEFIQRRAREFADEVVRQAGDDRPAQARFCLERVLQRRVREDEVARGVQLMDDLEQQEKMSPRDALVSFCTVALNLNEFLYVD